MSGKPSDGRKLRPVIAIAGQQPVYEIDWLSAIPMAVVPRRRTFVGYHESDLDTELECFADTEMEDEHAGA